MSFKLTWMPDVLLKAGLRVAESEGWRDRGIEEMGNVRGVMVHHTATASAIEGNMPTLRILERGRPAPDRLRGPLCNLGLGRDGTWYVIAAGKGNHAGPGRFRNITAGNRSFIGIEAEHPGDPKIPWPDAQMTSYQRGVAALLGRLAAPVDMCVAHKEWAPGRKVDPCFDMGEFRTAVSGWLAGKPPPPPVPAADGLDHPTLRRGSSDSEDDGPVEKLQGLLDIRADGDFGPKTEAALRAWQRRHGLSADGICGPKTWAKLLAPPDPAAVVALAASVGDGAMTLSPAGVELIHRLEACAKRRPDGMFEAYPDPGSRNQKPWTIGWGSTGKGLDGIPIEKGTVWNQQQCDDHFNHRIKRYVADVVRALDGAPTTQNQFDALVCFHYNTGSIASATLTKKHRARDYAGAEREFARWVRNDGKIMQGLINRRQAEAALYSGDGS